SRCSASGSIKAARFGKSLRTCSSVVFEDPLGASFLLSTPVPDRRTYLWDVQHRSWPTPVVVFLVAIRRTKRRPPTRWIFAPGCPGRTKSDSEIDRKKRGV